MPFPKLFKRHRTTSVIDDKAKARGPSSHSHLSVPVPELRHSSSMPQLVVHQNSLPVNGFVDSGSGFIDGNRPAGYDYLHISVPADSKLLPPTPTSPETSPARSEVSDDMGLGGMWHGINDRDANISKTEKIINKISDTANGAVNVGSSSDGVAGLVKNVMASDEAKAIGNAILEEVPAIMSALETLTEIHPFLKGSFYHYFLIIQLIEVERRENDHKRTTLFKKIKDVMLVLLELKGIGKDDQRTTPEGKPMLSRLGMICKDMKKDIEDCYNVLNAQEKRSVGIKFLKASMWNKELASYATRFTNRRADLTFALSMRSVVTMEEMNSKMMEMFSTVMSPQEREMGRWISQNGGKEAVLKSEEKCAEMIKFEAALATDSPAGHADKGRPVSGEEAKKNEAKAIAALRKEYREDIQGIIQENMEGFSKRFEMGLDDLGKELGNKIQHQGDRLIKYLQGGPHQRIKDKGWRGSAKTRPLVLALRDYFVERVEHSKLPPVSEELVRKRPVSSVPKQEEEDDNDDDPETDIGVPLPDSWMTAYLQVKRLRYLQQALDPDSSGFTTISEINAFTYARPEDWSFPRWVSYWCIGWQIYATKYCLEIEELFAQMMLLKFEIGVRMPGNKRYVNEYIEGCWQHVTAFTSAVERYDSPPPWLEEKFAGYAQLQESILKERLAKIQYDIDAVETVSLILRGDRIEGSIFILLALLLRRHVAKMHLCLKQEVDSQELWDDMDTVTWVVDAVWRRFMELKEQFQHQGIADLKQVFEGLSCGLFKNYWDWQSWLQPKYFMDNDMTPWSSVSTIRELDPSELTDGLLAYTGSKKPDHPSSDATPDPSSPPVADASETETAQTEKPLSPVLAKPSDAEMSITGTWYGWHWTDTQKPFLAMSSINFKCGDRTPDSETETGISGDGVSVNDLLFTLHGTLNSAGQPAGGFALTFQRIYADDGTWIDYTGTFQPERDIMTGTFERAMASGSFLFKKVPDSAIMCARPLKEETRSIVLVRTHDRNDQNLLNETEQVEYSKLLATFSFQQMQELNKLHDWYDRSGDLQPRGYVCDGCGTRMVRSRVVCLDCVSDDAPTATVDFCFRPECIASESLPSRLDVTHLPSHTMVQLRDLFLLKDYYQTKERAHYSLSSARGIHKDPVPDPSLLPLQDATIAVEANVSNAIVENTSTSTPIIAQQKAAAAVSLSPLDTSMSQRPVPNPEGEQSPTTASTTLLSAAVMPIEETVAEDQTLNCAFCHERVVSPCWYCNCCYGEWVCDPCEKSINELAPWEFQKRYRAEMATLSADNLSVHTVMHPLVRVARASAQESTKPDANDASTDTDSTKTEESSPMGQWELLEKRIQELVTARLDAMNSHVDKRLDDVDRRLDDVDSRLTTGLGNIERLLNVIAAREVKP
ncbi:hypothetical protein B0H13DRAFT_2482186 [Mycena leptocephala]|nr:hypothetical protein B0H13DRAFT_2482186 [Mycena leptocephala]